MEQSKVKPNSVYLSDYIIKHCYHIRQNTFIIAPTGSGKTYYILDVLTPGHKCLYLCDNNNLKSAVLKHPNTVEYGVLNANADVEVMTYKQFGKECIYRTIDFVGQYDYVIADEVHNLIDYSKFSKDTDLTRAIDALVQNYENTKIIFFTATPYYLDCIKTEYSFFLNNFKVWDFSKVREIKRYTNKRFAYISSMYQIKFILEEYKEAFMYNNWKCLIYTPKVTDMHKIEEIVIDKGLNPILLWSTSRTEEPMSTEQLITRAQLIETGYLKEPYNVLIINRATETGVNIYDEDMNLVIVNTINVTQQIQVRGRVRHDVDLLVLKDKDMSKVAKTIIIPPELLDVQLSKQTLEQFIKDYGLRNEEKKYITVNKFLSLIRDTYEVSKKKIRINGKQVMSYKIQLKKDKE